ncbi:unnamed protein product [Rhizoctonia solani]|uniref:Uncharacterized protein n=1 Tax=Rhizoctonia solani TaxID=456999 RepID=A0A8H3GIE1_9AGAM|nr:unnamed protein product [Rhizoctonia solani]
MFIPDFTAFASHCYHLLQVPQNSLTRLPYIRKYLYVSEATPLVAVTLCSLGMGMYLSQGSAGKRQPGAEISVQTSVEKDWHNADGVRETIQKELRK